VLHQFQSEQQVRSSLLNSIFKEWTGAALPAEINLDQLSANAKAFVDRLPDQLRQQLHSAGREHVQRYLQEMGWSSFWRERIAPLIAEMDGGVVAEPEISALLSRPCFGHAQVAPGNGAAGTLAPTEIKGRAEALERRMRRWQTQLELSAMMEERTFTDYRGVLESRFSDLEQDSRPIAKDAKSVLGTLKALADCATALQLSYLSDNLTAIADAVDQSRQRAESIAEVFGDPVVRRSQADSIRDLYDDVRKEFMTWQRRIAPAGAVLGSGVLFAVGLYGLVGSLAPTPIWLSVLLGVAVVAAARRYYRTRVDLERRIGAYQSALAFLWPDSRAEHSSFWSGNTSPDLQSELTRGFSSAREASAKQSRKKSRAFSSHGTVPIFGSVLLVFLYGDFLASRSDGDSLWPRFAAYPIGDAQRASSPCPTSYGVVYWAGPGSVAIRQVGDSSSPQLRGLAYLSPSAVGHLVRSMSSPACGGVTSASDVATYLLPRNGRASVLVPFVDEVRGCDPNDTGGARLSATTLDVVDRVGALIQRCSFPEKVRVDVRGFASDKDFECGVKPSDELNLQLAEARRAAVLERLIGDPSSRPRGGQTVWDTRGGFLLDHPGIQRWDGSIELMRRENRFTANPEQISRFAEIIVSFDGAGCLLDDV
jgi:hypothetical protein